MTLRLLHLADLHLDASFPRSRFKPNLPNLRREGLRQALKRALALASEKQVDAVTIGGDLFESERFSPDTAHFLQQQFAQLAPTRVLISPGNHDPFTAQSPYNFIEWSPNVHIFREPRLTRVALGDELDVWGAAHDSPSFFQPLLTNFRLPDDKPALLLLHGTDRGIALGKDKRAFCPFSFAEIQQSGFTLALLGHIHRPALSPLSAPRMCYPGSVEPLNFDEDHPHTFVLAEWNGQHWTTQTVASNEWQGETVQLDVTGMSSREQIIQRIRTLPQNTSARTKILLRVILQGAAQSSLDLDAHALREGVGDAFVDVSFQDQTLPTFDLAVLESEPTARGIFVRMMRAAVEKAEREGNTQHQETLEHALHFGLLALEGKDVPSA